MRRLVPLLAALALPGALAAPAGAQTVPTRATVGSCHASAQPLGRTAEFGAQMSSIAGTDHMQVRFDLESRAPGAAYRRLAAPGLGVWRSSAGPSVDIFRTHQQVANLPAPADVRAVVRFRWVDAAGAVLRHDRRTSPACHEPDPRADLVAGTIRAVPTADAGSDRLFVTVRNRGLADAGPFDVAIDVAGVAQPPQSVGSLAAGERTTVSVVAPHCRAGESVRVRVDSGDSVDEADERNTRVVACPVGS